MKAIFKNSVIVKLIILNMALLIVPITVFSIVTSVSMVSVLRENVKTINTNNFLKTIEKIELNFTDIRRIVSSISSNPNFSRIDLKQNSFREQLVVSYLKQCLSSNEFIYDIAYYLHGDDIIYTASSVSSIKTFYEDTCRLEDFDYDSFYKSVNSVSSPTAKIMKRITGNSGEPHEMLAYMYPINKAGPYATVIFYLESSKIKSLLENKKEMYESCSYVFNEEGNPVLEIGMNLASDPYRLYELTLKKDFNSKDEIIKLDNEKYIISFIESNNPKWTYVSLVKYGDVMQKVTKAQSTAFWTIAFILFFGILLIIIVTYRNYTPFHILYTKSRSLFSGNSGKNEIDSISRAIDHVWKTNVELNSSLEKYKPLVKEHFFKSVISGNYSNINELDNIGYELEISSNKYSYTVLIYKAAGFNEFEGCCWISDIEKKFADEIKLFYVDSLQKDRKIFVLYIEKNAISELKKIMLEIGGYFNCRYVASAGGINGDLLLLGQSFAQSAALLENVVVSKQNSVIIYDEASLNIKESKASLLYSNDTLKKVYIHIKNGNFPETQKCLCDLLDSVLNYDTPKFFLRCVIFDILNIFIKAMIEIDMEFDDIKEKHFNIIFKSDIDSFEEVENLVMQTAKIVCERFSQSDAKSSLITKIFEWISDNYLNYDFSIEKMAEHFKLSEGYISRVFKENTGYTIFNYVWGLRCENAKKLLSETNLPVKDIVKEIGYIDVSSFVRKFKETVRMTPIEYRKKNKK